MKKLLLFSLVLIFGVNLFANNGGNDPLSIGFPQPVSSFFGPAPLENDLIWGFDSDLKKKKKKKKKKGKKSEDGAFAPGKSYINVGYGIGNLTKTLFKLYSTNPGYKSNFVGPLNLSYEYGVSEKMALGVSMSYMSAKIEWTGEAFGDSASTLKEGFKGSSFRVMARMSYHMGSSEKLDPYFAFGIGYNASSWEFFSNDPYAIPLSVKGIPIASEGKFGMRYLVSPNVGLFGELGWGSAFLNLGLSLKL